MYNSMLEPESVVKDNSDYRFAIKSTDESELWLYTSDDELGPLECKIAPDENNIICKKFTEYFTIAMVESLSNHLYIDEEEL